MKFLKGEEQDFVGNSLMGESVKLLENQNQRVLENMQAADFGPVLAYEELYEEEQGGMRDVNRAQTGIALLCVELGVTCISINLDVVVPIDVTKWMNRWEPKTEPWTTT